MFAAVYHGGLLGLLREAGEGHLEDVDRDGDDDGVGGNQVGDRGGLRGLPRLGLRFRGQQLVLLSNAATSSQLCLGECPKLDFNML